MIMQVHNYMNLSKGRKRSAICVMVKDESTCFTHWINCLFIADYMSRGIVVV